MGTRPQSSFSVNSFLLPLVYVGSASEIDLVWLWLSWVFRHKLGIIYIHIGFYRNLISAVVEKRMLSNFSSLLSRFHLCVTLLWSILWFICDTILHLSQSKNFFTSREHKSVWEWHWSSQAAVFLSDSSDRLLPIFLHSVSLIPFPLSLSFSLFPSPLCLVSH